MSQYGLFVIGCLLLPILMVGASIWGHRMGRRRMMASPDAKELSTGTADAAILSLLGLLTAFTFSGAYSRYETRRQLIVEEANAIGTAYLRLDLLPTDKQPALRDLFRKYVESRWELWHLLPDRGAALAEYDRSAKLQQDIWSDAVEATQGESQGDARKLLLPALNAMIDITTTRLIAVQSHPPLIIFLLLGVLSIAAAWIIGFGMSKSQSISFPHILGFALIAAVALYVIIDIEYPRFGLVTLDGAHQLLQELKQQMK